MLLARLLVYSKVKLLCTAASTFMTCLMSVLESFNPGFQRCSQLVQTVFNPSELLQIVV